MNNSLKMPAVALDSLGCKLNQAEIELLSQELAEAGYRLVAPIARADIYILNTCTVTHIADRKSRHMLRTFHRRNPDARLVAIGCYAERAALELKRIEGVELVVGNDRKSELIHLLGNISSTNQPVTADLINVHGNSRRTRAFLKVQDGCYNFCAYCIVPLVRSREESVSGERIVAQVGERVSDGFKEVVLTGTEIGIISKDSSSVFWPRQILSG